jgi:hypothetical protein
MKKWVLAAHFICDNLAKEHPDAFHEEIRFAHYRRNDAACSGFRADSTTVAKPASAAATEVPTEMYG